jgi:inosine/xanthosine triphosphate pyrophosphatase family protein
MKLVLASQNRHKLEEMQAILAKYEPFAGEKRDYTKE